MKKSHRVVGMVRRFFVVNASIVAAMAGIGIGSSVRDASAQDLGTAVSQIVTIDRQRLFSDTQYGRRVVEAVENARLKITAENRKVEAELSEEERRLTAQKADLSPEEFRKLADAFDQKVQALRVKDTEREQEFVTKLEQDQAEFFERIGPVLGQLVRELGAVVILDQRAILLTTQNIDITDLAVKRINAVLGDGGVSNESSSATNDGIGGGEGDQLLNPSEDDASTAPATDGPSDN